MGRRGKGAGGGRGSNIVLEFKQPDTIGSRSSSAGSKSASSSVSRTAVSGPTLSSRPPSAELASDDNETLLEKLVQTACDEVSQSFNLHLIKNSLVEG